MTQKICDPPRPAAQASGAECLTIVYVWRLHLPMDRLEILRECSGFQWDEGNADKNWIKHRVSPREAEEMFFNEPLVVALVITPASG